MSRITLGALALLLVAVASIAHIVSLLALPWRSDEDAFARIAMAVPAMGRAPLGAAGRAAVPYADPAFLTEVCRFDLGAKPFRLTLSPFGEGFISIGFHGRHGVAFYGLTVRSSDATSFDLVLDRTTDASPAAVADQGSHTVSVTAPETEGFVVLSTPSDDDSGHDAARDRLSRIACRSDGGTAP